MDIPLDAAVYCIDGRAGVSSNVVVNPLTAQITHLIVRLDERPHREYLVPLEDVGETTAASINLHLTSEQLKLQEPFVVTEFIPVKIPHYEEMAYSWPLVQTEEVFEPVHEYRIPPGELPVHRGTEVDASDGPIGRIDEFVAKPDGYVTHLVMREGHLWGQRDIVIPVNDVESFSKERVQLKLNKQQVASLPTVKIRR